MQRTKRAAIVTAWVLGCWFAAHLLWTLLAVAGLAYAAKPIEHPLFWLLFGALVVTTSRRWSLKERAVRFAGFALIALISAGHPAEEQRPARMDELCEHGHAEACELLR
jgi:hypothetical protein